MIYHSIAWLLTSAQHQITLWSFLWIVMLKLPIQSCALICKYKQWMGLEIWDIMVTFKFFKSVSNINLCYTVIQWKQLNMISLGQRGTDNINTMITITNYLYKVIYCYVQSNLCTTATLGTWKSGRLTEVSDKTGADTGCWWLKLAIVNRWLLFTGGR